jgi:hypothetical protein
MRRFGTALLLAAVVCTLAAGAAHAAPRAYVGVLDDESLRWAPSASERIASWSLLQRDHASVVRTMVDWATIAQRRPANGASPFDPAYRWADLDDFVRNAQQRGIEVLLTLWGTPRWANGGKNPNVPPTDPRTFGRFAHAVAARYSGRYPGLPFARFLSIWNEPNTPRFLAAADPVRAYASLAAAGVAGIRSGSPQALVAIGETAASHAPGTFMEKLAARDPHLDFDAWAHHPYPARSGQSPDRPEAWPAVGVRELAAFGDDVDRAFGRANTPVWVTEFAESLPAVSRARQAHDLAQAAALATAVPRVQMFVWLMLRNHPGELWQSGLADGPGNTVFSHVAAAFDPRNGVFDVSSETGSVALSVPALELRWQVAAGSYVTIAYTVSSGGVAVASGTEPAAMGRDGWVPVRVRLPHGGTSYALSVRVTDTAGMSVRRRLRLMRPAAATRPAAAAAPSRRSP